MTLARARWPKDLPHGNIHADLFPDNVFFIGDEVSGVIDFYFACTDALAYDLAVCLNAWCFEPDGAFNLTKGRALLSGYCRLRALTAAEIEALPLLARGAALRFLLTRLVDWLNVPPGALVEPKDPIEYLRKLRFHARVTSAAEYGLRMTGAQREPQGRHDLHRRRVLGQSRAEAAMARSWSSASIERRSRAARRTPPITAWS